MAPMHLIGNVIKQAIGLRQQLVADSKEPAEIQENQLKDLLHKARDTAFGKYYGFQQIMEAENIQAEFRQRVPVFDYDQMYNEWWKQTLQIPDITWPGKPEYFALSSGTTGKESKRIPVTEDMISSIRNVGVSQLTSIANFDLPSEFFENQVLMLGSTTKLKQVDGHQEGEISGISVSQIPTWFDAVCKPGPEISAIEDWDERVNIIARKAPEWNIGAISGIPSWILLLLREIIRYNHLNNIHEIWPNLSIYTPGGVAFEPFKPSFEEVFGKKVIYMDTYLASEGFFAYNCRPETTAMKLAIHHGIYFEFIPFDKRGFDESGELIENPLVMDISQIDTRTNYAMIVSTCAGSWRYMIGDTIRFTNIEEHEIEITGRTKYFLNVVGSQLSENKMNDAIQVVQKKYDLHIEEFTVAAVKDEKGDYYHEWIIGEEDGKGDPEKVAETMDKTFMEINKNYGVARSKALHGLKVVIVPTKKIYDWHARERKKGGQIKTQKLMKEEDFLKFKEFVLAS